MLKFDNVNYYKLLNIESTASKSEIKKAYFKLAHIFHPDKNKSHDAEEKFKLITKAYQVLSNDTLRNEYDLFIDAKNETREQKMRNEKAFKATEVEIEVPKKIDYLMFHRFLNKDFDLSKLTEEFEKISLVETISLYSFFWTAFWKDKKTYTNMIKNNSLVKFYDFFFSYFKNKNIDFISQYRIYFRETNDEEIQSKIKYYQESFNSINKTLKFFNFNESYEYIQEILNSGRIFIDETFFLFSIELNKEIRKFFSILIKIEQDRKNVVFNQRKTSRRKIKQKKVLHKVKSRKKTNYDLFFRTLLKWLSLLIAIAIILFLLIYWFRETIDYLF